MEIQIYSGISRETEEFPIAMLEYQRVAIDIGWITQLRNTRGTSDGQEQSALLVQSHQSLVLAICYRRLQLKVGHENEEPDPETKTKSYGPPIHQTHCLMDEFWVPFWLQYPKIQLRRSSPQLSEAHPVVSCGNAAKCL